MRFIQTGFRKQESRRIASRENTVGRRNTGLERNTGLSVTTQWVSIQWISIFTLLSTLVANPLIASGQAATSKQGSIRPGLVSASAQDERPYLDVAKQVALWLDTMAIENPDGPGTVWKISEQRPTHQYSLYSGSSGVVLFYLQLYRQTNDRRYLEQAHQGGLAIAAHIGTLDQDAQSGFWVGSSGMAYVMWHLGLEIDRQDFHASAHVVVDRLIEQAHRDESSQSAQLNAVTDVISGNAGIGQFLLFAASEMDRDDALDLAIELGNGLLMQSQSANDGEPSRQSLRWMMTPEYEREMPNYSHGTAGVADYLLSLGTTLLSEDRREEASPFINASLAGAYYLDAIAQRSAKDQCLIAHHFPDGENLFYLGWCHGPAGTGRFFQRLLDSGIEAFDHDRLQDNISASANSILRSGIPESQTDGFWNNVGVCCGSAGVSSYMLQLGKRLDHPAMIDFAERLIDDLIDRAETQTLTVDGESITSLRWTHAEHRVRPELLEAQTGFMQGAAGIGLCLLEWDAYQNTIAFPFELPLSPTPLSVSSR